MYVGKRIGATAESLIPDYPPASGRPLPKIYMLDGQLSKYKSRKQRAFVAINIANGKLKTPYPRTGKLGQSIQAGEPRIEGDNLIVPIGTNREYAPLVIGDDSQQSKYHAETGWWQLPKVIQAGGPAISNEVAQVLRGYVVSTLRGRS